jgi:SMC interacting uncharacterized protein involved in chromosome segregation
LDHELKEEKKNSTRQIGNLNAETEKVNDILKEHKRTIEMLRSEMGNKEEFFRESKRKWENERHILEQELSNFKLHLQRSLQSNQKQVLEEELLVTRASLQQHKDAFQVERSNLFRQVQSNPNWSKISESRINRRIICRY